MQNWINKHFRKSKCVKVVYFGEGKKNSTYYLIPKDSTVHFEGKAFMINQDDFFLDNKNFITYVFSYNRVEPIDPNNAKTLGTITPANLSIALDSNVASQILSATSNKPDINIFLFAIMFLMIIGFGAVWYLLSEQLKSIYDILEPLRDVITP